MPKNAMPDLPTIPLCQSEFLQDFTIRFGVYISKRKPGWSNCYRTSLDFCEHEGESFERLAVWISTYDFTRISINLWEDKTIWVGVDLLASDRHTSEYGLSFYPIFQCGDFDGLLEALDATVSISTRLCYGESPVETLRKIWNHKGEIKSVGTLSKNPSDKNALQK